jgi:hypothetical protein
MRNKLFLVNLVVLLAFVFLIFSCAKAKKEPEVNPVKNDASGSGGGKKNGAPDNGKKIKPESDTQKPGVPSKDELPGQGAVGAGLGSDTPVGHRLGGIKEDDNIINIEGIWHFLFKQETYNWICIEEDDTQYEIVKDGKLKDKDYIIVLEWYYKIDKNKDDLESKSFIINRYKNKEASISFDSELQKNMAMNNLETNSYKIEQNEETSDATKEVLSINVNFVDENTANGEYKEEEPSIDDDDCKSWAQSGEFTMDRVISK